MKHFGLAVMFIATVALACAFIPQTTIFALLVALLGLALGILLLIVDRGFNLYALLGTFVASAAVSMAIIMGMVYGG